MKTLSVACVVALLAVSTASADHKEWNKYFVGSWTLEDGSGEQELKLAADGNAVVGKGTSADGEESVWVMGWDPSEKVIIHEWFGATHGRAAYKIIDDKTLRGTLVFSTPNEVVKATAILTKKDDNAYTVKLTDATANGERSDDYEVVVKKK